MKRGSFRKPTYEEAIEKARIKDSQRAENARTAKLKPKTRKSKEKPKTKKLSTAKLKKKLDEIFSKYIRQKYANQEGQVQCYTCPKTAHWKEMQCGHFVSRSALATRFSEDNCRVQCVGCNIFGGGQVATFANNLERENEGIVTTLYRKSQEITKDFPYQEKIAYYQSLLETESKNV